MNQSLKLHDMVLIKDNELLARNEWRRGVVHKLNRCYGNGKVNYIKRNVKRLIPFE